MDTTIWVPGLLFVGAFAALWLAIGLLIYDPYDDHFFSDIIMVCSSGFTTIIIFLGVKWLLHCIGWSLSIG